MVPIFPAWATGNSWSCHLCPLGMPQSLCFSFFLALTYFLSLHIQCPGICIFLALVLESSISPRTPGSSYWMMMFNINLGTRCAHCYWGAIISRSSQLTEQGDMLYANTCVCIYLLISLASYYLYCLYMHLYLC